ncbi:MAG: ATP-binding protein [Desulfobulbaceae bacterium]|nr:ATP-binding protein [Desulfobulbaceae bacterium]
MTYSYTKKTQSTGFTIALSAEYENIAAVCQEVEKCLNDHQLQDILFSVILCVREALVNAIKHGCMADSAKQVIFHLNLQETQLIIKVGDEGPGFDWSCLKNKKDPTTCCGRGIRIMKQYFDTVIFNEQGNEVELRKKIPNIAGY